MTDGALFDAPTGGTGSSGGDYFAVSRYDTYQRSLQLLLSVTHSVKKASHRSLFYTFGYVITYFCHSITSYRS